MLLDQVCKFCAVLLDVMETNKQGVPLWTNQLLCWGKILQLFILLLLKPYYEGMKGRGREGGREGRKNRIKQCRSEEKELLSPPPLPSISLFIRYETHSSKKSWNIFCALSSRTSLTTFCRVWDLAATSIATVHWTTKKYG